MNSKIDRAHKAMAIVQRSIAAEKERRYTEAIDLLRQAVKVNPNDVEMLRAVAQRFKALNQHDDQLRLIRSAVRLSPRKWDLHFELGRILHQEGKIEEAMACMRKAYACNPPTSMPLYTLARLLDMSSKITEFESVVELASKRWPADDTTRALQAWLKIKHGELEQGELMLRDLLATPKMTVPEILPASMHRLAAVVEKQKRFEEAWEIYTASREGRFELMGRPDAGITEWMRVCTEGLQPEQIHAWKNRNERLTIPGQRYALLCGFPRSGTTLLEVVLASHPSIATMEEKFYTYEAVSAVQAILPEGSPLSSALDTISEADRLSIRRKYITRCRKLLGHLHSRPVIIDKHPGHTPLAPFFLWMLPGAQIIMPLRDPRDVVVSNFTQDMQNSTLVSLDRIVEFYEGCMNAWLKWRDWIGDSAIEVRYEDTVMDLEGQSRRILDHLGLDWDPALLSFHERVKTTYVGTPSYEGVSQPVNTKAVGRWRRYEEQLKPILPRLEPFVEAFGYDPS